MTPQPRRSRREGWPWPATQASLDHDALAASQNLVNVAALEVEALTEALRLALQRFEQAHAEASLTSEAIATREADQAIAQARRHDA